MMQPLRFEHVIQLLLESFRLWTDKQVDKLENAVFVLILDFIFFKGTTSYGCTGQLV